MVKLVDIVRILIQADVIVNMSEEHIIGKNLNSKDHARLKKGLILGNDGKVSHETYNHEEIMDQMVKVIEFTKMHKKMRSVLLLRLIHGFTIQRMQIYLFLHGHILGNSHDELMELEAEGKRLMLATLRKHSMQDIVATINATPSIITGLRNELTNPDPNIGLS